MTESEFLQHADRILASLHNQADEWFEKMDIELEAFRNGNVLTIIFENGTQVIINSQAPKQEMWLAAKRGGFHYKFMDGQWVDTRHDQTLQDALTLICSEQSGHPLTVTL